MQSVVIRLDIGLIQTLVKVGGDNEIWRGDFAFDAIPINISQPVPVSVPFVCAFSCVRPVVSPPEQATVYVSLHFVMVLGV